VAGPAAWAELGDPLAGRGLVALSVVSLLVVPVVMLAVVTTPGALAKAAVPRSWRAWWRRGRKHPRPKALLVRTVRAADRNRCVGCGVRQAELKAAGVVLQMAGQRPRTSLELDHYFPFSLGGLLILWNLFLLCPRCNVVKSNYWRDDHGHVTYRAFAGFRSTHEAAAILRREWLARFSLFRWWRAAWAL
jgi:5-methylcytosine-specific restriction endonuclease McrA